MWKVILRYAKLFTACCKPVMKYYIQFINLHMQISLRRELHYITFFTESLHLTDHLLLLLLLRGVANHYWSRLWFHFWLRGFLEALTTCAEGGGGNYFRDFWNNLFLLEHLNGICTWITMITKFKWNHFKVESTNPPPLSYTRKRRWSATLPAYVSGGGGGISCI